MHIPAHRERPFWSNVNIPDNFKSGVSKACRYDPDLNPIYQQLAAHYPIAVVPARPYKSKDKSKVEVAVQIVERWILARLRHHAFFSLSELNRCIRDLLVELNHKPFKQLSEGGPTLAAAERVVVGERISRNGRGAIRQPGDLEGFSPTFDLSNREEPVSVIITEVVR